MVQLRPQDVLVGLKLATNPGRRWTFADLGLHLGLSASESHAALQRLGAAMLVDVEERRPRIAGLLEFLEHGIRYVFVSSLGAVTRGFPTAHSAPPLSGAMAVPENPLFRAVRNAADTPTDEDVVSANDLPVVWPHQDGTARGHGLEPIYPSAVDAALRDPALYEALALVDALRVGRARERKIAAELLRKRIRGA
jgi:hypothetical protein